MKKPMFLLTGHTCLKLYRFPPGVYVGGRFVEAVPTVYQIKANVQPSTKWNEVQSLPEGQRNKPLLKLYSSFPLRERSLGVNATDSDRFMWTDGHMYEVIKVYNYEMGVLNHYKALAARIEEPVPAIMTAADSFNGPYTTGQTPTFSTDKKTVSNTVGTSTSTLAVTSNTLHASGQWFAKFEVDYTDTNFVEFVVGFTNSTFNVNSPYSPFAAIGVTTAENGELSIAADVHTLNSVVLASGHQFYVYIDTVARTWGCIDSQGTNFPNLQEQIGDYSHIPLGMPSGALKMVAVAIGSTASGSGTVTVKALPGPAPSGLNGYMNVAGLV